jgi:hypothetical protein
MPRADLAARDLSRFGSAADAIDDQGDLLSQRGKETTGLDPQAGGQMPESQAMMASICAARRTVGTEMSAMGSGLTTFASVASNIGAKYIDTHQLTSQIMGGAAKAGGN